MDIKLNLSYYVSIMLDAFKDLLCLKLCWHNRPGPRQNANPLANRDDHGIEQLNSLQICNHQSEWQIDINQSMCAKSKSKTKVCSKQGHSQTKSDASSL